jgi:pyruvate formate lyase activating enzyme
MKLTRRDLLKKGSIFGLGLGISPFLLEYLSSPSLLAALGKPEALQEAMYYKMIDEKTAWCRLCPWKCILAEGVRSVCRVREVRKGKFYTLAYGNPCSVHVDPIEKKPVFHLLPGSTSFSLATAGCNLRCKFCQNWQISQFPPEETVNYKLSPEEVVEKAVQAKSRSIAYTYSEPIIFYEYMLDTAKLARKKNIKGVWVTAGYINEEPLKELAKYIDVANIDLKGFTDEFYINVCGGELKYVLETLKTARKEGIWVEVTNLIIPTLNDDLKTIEKMCRWLKENLGPDVPLHFSRFHPMYKLKNLDPTPVKTLENARKTALRVGLNYVYIGNVPGHEGNNTYCPNCKKILIQRLGYKILRNNIEEGKCKFCGRKIPGIWN